MKGPMRLLRGGNAAVALILTLLSASGGSGLPFDRVFRKTGSELTSVRDEPAANGARISYLYRDEAYTVLEVRKVGNHTWLKLNIPSLDVAWIEQVEEPKFEKARETPELQSYLTVSGPDAAGFPIPISLRQELPAVAGPLSVYVLRDRLDPKPATAIVFRLSEIKSEIQVPEDLRGYAKVQLVFTSPKARAYRTEVKLPTPSVKLLEGNDRGLTGQAARADRWTILLWASVAAFVLALVFAVLVVVRMVRSTTKGADANNPHPGVGADTEDRLPRTRGDNLPIASRADRSRDDELTALRQDLKIVGSGVESVRSSVSELSTQLSSGIGELQKTVGNAMSELQTNAGLQEQMRTLRQTNTNLVSQCEALEEELSQCRQAAATHAQSLGSGDGELARMRHKFVFTDVECRQVLQELKSQLGEFDKCWVALRQVLQDVRLSSAKADVIWRRISDSCFGSFSTEVVLDHRSRLEELIKDGMTGWPAIVAAGAGRTLSPEVCRDLNRSLFFRNCIRGRWDRVLRGLQLLYNFDKIAVMDEQNRNYQMEAVERTRGRHAEMQRVLEALDIFPVAISFAEPISRTATTAVVYAEERLPVEYCFPEWRSGREPDREYVLDVRIWPYRNRAGELWEGKSGEVILSRRGEQKAPAGTVW